MAHGSIFVQSILLALMLIWMAFQIFPVLIYTKILSRVSSTHIHKYIFCASCFATFIHIINKHVDVFPVNI